MTEGREDEVKMGLLVMSILFKKFICWLIYIKCICVQYDSSIRCHTLNVNIEITLIAFFSKK